MALLIQFFTAHLRPEWKNSVFFGALHSVVIRFEQKRMINIHVRLLSNWLILSALRDYTSAGSFNPLGWQPQQWVSCLFRLAWNINKNPFLIIRLLAAIDVEWLTCPLDFCEFDFDIPTSIPDLGLSTQWLDIVNPGRLSSIHVSLFNMLFTRFRCQHLADLFFSSSSLLLLFGFW